ncbi:hypothetical protein I5677_15245 [Mobilitalea sibirica]|uniref:Uncharacterized protein n=1 Tax=Mobilitalea sibirica TaxID=1462919 RepID=A0A8J7H4G6_9FIRM|nr:hypothetical protein [Mobilitalea sibirica]MBH1942255.1 hypothetical protein [Mobilitalea sibirica]
MDKKRLYTIGKWSAVILLISGNFISYRLNNTPLNLVLALLVFAYSIYEFFLFLKVKKLNTAIKLYLFTFYLFAVLTLLTGLQSLLVDNFQATIICALLVVGDIILILFTIHRLDNFNQN